MCCILFVARERRRRQGAIAQKPIMKTLGQFDIDGGVMLGLFKRRRLVTSTFFTRGEFEAALDVLNAGAAERRGLVTDAISLDETPARIGQLRQRMHDCAVFIEPDK
jgi:threonine dehydrogenase-like Zn-dependent dehydrogenase